MISIIIPCYNHEKYIKKTLDSILEDDFEDKEIVIIDDGSTDNSPKVISNWVEQNKDKISITYKHRPNKGLNRTLNELLSLTKGEYIVDIGSDDFLLKGGLRTRYEFMKKHPDIDVLISDAIVVDAEGNTISDSILFDFRGYEKEQFKDQETIKNTLFRRFATAGAIYMTKREFFDKIGYYDEELLAEDLEFSIKALGLGKVAFLDEKVSAYRVHDTNQSIGNIKPKLLGDSAKAFYRNMHLFPLKDKPIMLWNIFKFLVREKLLQLKLLFKKN